MRIAVGGLNFEDAITKFENGDIESTTTKVEYNNLLVFILFETIGHCRSSWLIHDTTYFEASNFTSILSGLTLRIVEVGRHRNNSFGNFLTQESLGVSLNFAQNHSRNTLLQPRN